MHVRDTSNEFQVGSIYKYYISYKIGMDGNVYIVIFSFSTIIYGNWEAFIYLFNFCNLTDPCLEHVCAQCLSKWNL